MNEQHRLILALVLSTIIIFGWQFFFTDPQIKKEIVIEHSDNRINEEASVNRPEYDIGMPRDRNAILNDTSRITIKTDYLEGSINLSGARIDDLSLVKYNKNINSDEDKIILLSPSGTQDVYFAEFGWISDDKSLVLPDKNSIWQSDKTTLSAGDVVTLVWKNSEGVTFKIKVELDNFYMFKITQSIENPKSDIVVRTYSVLSRSRGEAAASNAILHEGAISVVNGKLEEVTFDDIISDKKVVYENNSSWIGFSDKYWLTALIPSFQNKARFSEFDSVSGNRFQVDQMSAPINIKKSEFAEATTLFFAGAKELEVLDNYQADFGIALFDRSVDFGILYFVTKPIFILLNYFHKFSGNFGIAILLLTVVIKIGLFPLAYKGFKGMNKLKDLQPMMAELKEKYSGDAIAFQQATLALYKREKVNPMAGCLPIILQMPIFFALYKVLYVTIEMRHAPFLGWIKDLSVPDPTSIFNLFGLLPWSVPSFLMIGVLPIIMALTMFVQQRLNPEPTDPMQAKIMKMLPLIFLFMFSSFPSGLILYWAWSNTLSILQQLFIKQIVKD